SMSDLYLSENPFKSSNVDSNVAASGTSEIVDNVYATVNASEGKPRSVENLGKDDTNPTIDDTTIAEASTKADVNPADDFVQKLGSETH
ncbi:hypothetical protein A2U01_0082445, partial [Trifolium medium]|nr:hypothetical protein [Trifolium medium]